MRFVLPAVALVAILGACRTTELEPPPVPRELWGRVERRYAETPWIALEFGASGSVYRAVFGMDDRVCFTDGSNMLVSDGRRTRIAQAGRRPRMSEERIESKEIRLWIARFGAAPTGFSIFSSTHGSMPHSESPDARPRQVRYLRRAIIAGRRCAWLRLKYRWEPEGEWVHDVAVDLESLAILRRTYTVGDVGGTEEVTTRVEFDTPQPEETFRVGEK